MNLHEIISEDRKLEAIQLARRWSKHNLISETSAVKIAEAHPSRLRQQPLFLRGIQFVGVFVAGLALTVAIANFIEMASPDNSDRAVGTALLLCALAMGLIALGAMRRGYYAAGIDEGAWGAAILGAGLGLQVLIDFDTGRAFALGVLITAILPAVYGYFLSSLFVWASASWLILDLTDLRLFAVTQAVFLTILIVSESKFVWRRRARQIGSLVVASGASCLLACNSFLPNLFGIPIDEAWLNMIPLSGWLSILVMISLTTGYLAIGFSRLDRRVVDVGLLSLAVVLLTFAHAVAGWSLEVSMIIVGLTLIVGALLARRALIGRNVGPALTAPPVVAPRGWTMEDAQGTANWMKEAHQGFETTASWAAVSQPIHNAEIFME